MLSIKEAKQELGRRVEIVTQPEFLNTRIRPHLGPSARTNGAWQTRVLQLDGTGPATVEIMLGGQSRIFAKLYADHGGEMIYKKIRSLRAAGFGPGERYQAVEPLGFIPEYDMLLTRTVEGRALSEYLHDDEALMAGVREAATWLARLHSSSLRIGPPRPLLESSEVLSVTRRLAKVVALRPQWAPVAVEMVRKLERVAEDTTEGLLVQTHGQYRPIHVFLGGPTVTVIDLDRSRPCDPARDVAEFIHRLRVSTVNARGALAAADAPTRAFLETYAAAVADPSYLTNLRFHWARYVMHTFDRKVEEYLQAGDGADPEQDPTVTLFRTEFENILDGRFDL